MLVPEIPMSKVGYIYIYIGLVFFWDFPIGGLPTLGPRGPPHPNLAVWFQASAGTPSPRPIGGPCLESPQRLDDLSILAAWDFFLKMIL